MTPRNACLANRPLEHRVPMVPDHPVERRQGWLCNASVSNCGGITPMQREKKMEAHVSLMVLPHE